MTGHPHLLRQAPCSGARRVAVVGGGVMGGFTAANLIRAGAQVTLYDPHPMGTGPGASVDTGRSFRVHYGTDEGLVSMAVRARRLWAEWSVQLGRPLLHETGKLWWSSRDRHDGELEDHARMGLRATASGGAAWPRNGRGLHQATVDRLGGVLDPEVILLGCVAGQ